MNPKASVSSVLLEGQAIPALPLALDHRRHWSERHQRAVVRYYADAGVGGIAVGVHSTQFAIRASKHGLYKPVLSLVAETIGSWVGSRSENFLKIAGICGPTDQATREADLARSLGYDAGLLSMGALRNDPESALLSHCIAVAAAIPLIGFYLQPSVGGRALSYRFWRSFAEIPNVVAIKIAPFNRYQTLDVVRAVGESGRTDLALYTGNDDSIIVDLISKFRVGERSLRIAGGLLGQWGVWTERAVALFKELKRDRAQKAIPAHWLERNAALTDTNGAVFDAANGFAGCIPGIHEVLRRQGIFETNVCLDPNEGLSRGQADELDRVMRAYPWLIDDDFVQQNLSRWLA